MLIGYARVSTRDQTPEMQIQTLTEAGCERIFTETATGSARDRPQLAAALDYLRHGDTLVVWKLDRLARSLRQLLDTIETLHASGVELRSLTEAIDTATPSGMLFFQISGAFTQFERAIIRERTLAGLEAAAAHGRHPGRPPKLGPEDITAARAMLKEPALSTREVARRLGVSVSTLYRHIPAARSGTAED